MEDLIAYEQGARIICGRYENEIRNNEIQGKQDRDVYENFNRYNKVYMAIIDTIKQKLEDVSTNETVK
jgi:hypothetical protein